MNKFSVFSVVTCISVFIMGACKGVCDTLEFHYSSSFYARFNPYFWNAAISWKNKYVNADLGDLHPRFPLSTTWLVTFTDAWHTFQFVQNMAFVFALLCFGAASHYDTLNRNVWFYVITAAIIFTARQLGFFIFYR